MQTMCFSTRTGIGIGVVAFAIAIAIGVAIAVAISISCACTLFATNRLRTRANSISTTCYVFRRVRRTVLVRHNEERCDYVGRSCRSPYMEQHGAGYNSSRVWMPHVERRNATRTCAWFTSVGVE